MSTAEEDRSFEFKLNNNTIKIHLGHDYMLEPDNRRFTYCVIETVRHEFYSGIAMSHPKELHDVKTGWKISLKRACNAMSCLFGDQFYKHFWHEIRLQLWNEMLKEAVDKGLNEA